MAQGTTTTESYTYDAVGNRLSSLGLSPYTYNTSNELTSTPSATYTYDNNGNMFSKADSTGTNQFTWDYENRLASVVLPGNGGTVTFKYDPLADASKSRSSKGQTPRPRTTSIRERMSLKNSMPAGTFWLGMLKAVASMSRWRRSVQAPPATTNPMLWNLLHP